jgi:hypothetical protein
MRKFYFIASLQGNQQIVHIQKEYAHNFEPASNWPKLLEFIDAGTDFNKIKIMLKKKLTVNPCGRKTASYG